MTLTVKRVANMVFITDDSDQVWQAWDEREFTERKLKNAMNRIQKWYSCPIEFIRTF